MATPAMPEPMNSTPHHSKVKVSLLLPDKLFIAGEHVSGKMEMECRADQGLGLGVMMVELFAVQELTSRDHSATRTFLHSRRLFQGPGLPPSNAVDAHPSIGAPLLPPNYYQARRGRSTFLFRIPLPGSLPSSISFGGGLAQVRYELRASVAACWKGETRLVTAKQDLEIIESYEENISTYDPEAVIVGENGKFWMQGRIIGGFVVAGQSACVELQVKNHSNKKNTALTLTLSRSLVLPGSSTLSHQPLQISDTLMTVPFRGQEYTIHPGVEGVAHLVFDVPPNARGVRGGIIDGDESEGASSESLFEIRCIVEVKMSMGLRRKDIALNIPVTVVHPAALPEQLPDAYFIPTTPYPYAVPENSMTPTPYIENGTIPYAYPTTPVSAPAGVYLDSNYVWLPPPLPITPQPQLYATPVYGYENGYLATPPPPPPMVGYVPRPSSAGPASVAYPVYPGLPTHSEPQMLLPLEVRPELVTEPEKGKGERATRVAQHLRLSSRHRSVSPQSHRYPMPTSLPPVHVPGPPSSEFVFDDDFPSSPKSQNSGVVHSPRPQLTPKHSFQYDPVAKHSVSKSERVEELERMADEVAQQSLDLSSDIPKSPLKKKGAADIYKTLPGPPVPGEKVKFLSPERARLDTHLSVAEHHKTLLIPSDKTPPTPTLTPVLPAKRSQEEFLAVPSNGDRESGLDALERRLLAEVGTQKMKKVESRPHVAGLHPITIPTNPAEPLNDSAISSLTLAHYEFEHDHDSDVKTHKPGHSSISGDDRDAALSLPVEKEKKESSPSSRGRNDEYKKPTKEKEKKREGKKKDRVKDGEKAKSSNGRVAAWLVGIEPAVPPPEDEVPSSPSVARTPGTFFEPEKDGSKSKTPAVEPATVAPTKQESPIMDSLSSAPNPRSSGFVPLHSPQRNPPLTKEVGPKHAVEVWSRSPHAETRHAISPSLAITPVPTPSKEAPSQPALRGRVGRVNPNLLKHGDVPQKAIPSSHPERQLKTRLRLPVDTLLSDRQDPDIKYDIRSARGGRGGKVAAVASIWANAAEANGKINGVIKTTNHQPAPAELLVPKPTAGDRDKKTRTKTREFRPLIQQNVNVKDGLEASESQPQMIHESGASTSGAGAKLQKSSKSSDAVSQQGVFEQKFVVGLAGKRSRPIIKSTSVPAIVSSSHAIPMLSSTASLARPHSTTTITTTNTTTNATNTSIATQNHQPGRIKSPVSVTARKFEFGLNPATSPPPPTSKPGDLAFGQARLRDLIKKYQNPGV